MSVTDLSPDYQPVPAPPPDAIPQDVSRKQSRGRKEMQRDAVKRRVCMEYTRGNTYGYEDSRGRYQQLATVTGADGSGKPRHRIRNKYDFIGPIIDAKVSAATRRTPAYDVLPSNASPESEGGAKLAVKVATYGYDKWRYSTAKEKVIRLALGGGGVGYALPYFDPNVGPYTQVGDRLVGQGEIKIMTFTGNQVYSEPGVDFDDSPWFAIDRARPLEQVQELDGFITSIKLKADAIAAEWPDQTVESDNLVIVTEFFERPCPKYPEGRAMVFANGRPIVDQRLIDPMAENWWADYPLRDHQDRVVDEPLLHRLVYRHDGSRDSDLGLTWLLIDFERTIQDCYNKIVEWKNRALNPQMIAPVNSIKTRRTDEPGDIIYYTPQGNGLKPEWEQAPQPPQALYTLIDRALSDMRDIAADNDFNADPNVAAKTVNAVDIQAQSRWEKFMTSVEEWDSRLMRHCLLLVARHYTEPRLLAIRGRWDQPQRLEDFKGGDLFGETNIRVVPGSSQAKSRAQVQQELAWIQANWPGYLSPEVAIAALHNAQTDDLIKSYDLDMSRVWGVIQDLVNGTLMDRPEWPQTVVLNAPQIDPNTGQPLVDPNTGMPVTAPTPTTMMVPNWMPTENDSIPIWKRMFGDWMKTQEFADLDVSMQDMANKIWQAIEQQEQQKAARAQQAQQAQAMELGFQNAATPAVKGVPSQPGDGISPSPPQQPQQG